MIKRYATEYRGHDIRRGRAAMTSSVRSLVLLSAIGASIVGIHATDANLTLTAVDGLRVGHFTLAERPTGCTVVLTSANTVASVDVRGAAPGTRETDVLDPVSDAQTVNAI